MTEDPGGHEPLTDGAVTWPGPHRPGDLMVWLGGGQSRDIAEVTERSAYQSTGLAVLLATLASGAVTAGAATGGAATGGGGGLSLPAAAVVGLLAGLFVGALGRVLATAPGRRGTLLGLALVAVPVGVVLGELAAMVIFSGPISEQLGSRVEGAATSSAGSEAVGRLAQLRAERAALDDRVAAAGTRRDAALVVARCEYHPAPGCPAQLITGEAGRGPEAEQARAELAGADTDLTAARAERDRRVPQLDGAISSAADRVDRDRDAAEALVKADTGLVARWEAMNSYTAGRPVALIPRLGTVLVMVLLVVAPLLLRLWRGQTDHERLVSARRIRRWAEEDADTALAVRRAQVRVELGLRHQEELLTPPDRAALPASSVAEAAERPPAEPSDQPPGETALAVPERRGPLDLLPGPLPLIGRAVGGVAGAFVPAPVARYVDGTRPMRIMRTLMEDVEEFQFTMVRKRRVTVTEEHHDEAPGQAVHDAPGQPRRSVVLTRVLRDFGGPGHELRGDLERNLTVDAPSASLESRKRELPPGDEPA